MLIVIITLTRLSSVLITGKMLSRFNITFGLAALAALANAAHYDVTVGKGGQLKFDPETLTAQPGDTVTYKFFAKVTMPNPV